MQLALQTRHWVWMNWVALLVGPCAWFLVFGLLYNWDSWALDFVSPYYGLLERTVGNKTFWMVFFLTNVLALVPYMMSLFWASFRHATPVDNVRVEMVRQDKLPWPQAVRGRPLLAGQCVAPAVITLPALPPPPPVQIAPPPPPLLPRGVPPPSPLPVTCGWCFELS